MHTCKIKTNEMTVITSSEYQRLQQSTTSTLFQDGIRNAQETIMKKRYTPDVRQFQSTFTLPMKRNFFGLLSIPIYVNHFQCRFLLDTGAQISGIRSQCRNAIDLSTNGGSLGVGSIGGKEKTMPGCIAEHVQIGALEYHQMPMITLNEKEFSLRFGGVDLMGFDGILGWDVLSKLDFEMDDIAKQFKVMKTPLRYPGPNMLAGSFPIFIVRQDNGKPALYGFDSGSKVSWLSEAMMEREGLNVISEGNAMGFGVHGLEKLPMKIADRIQLRMDRAVITLQDTMSGRCDLFPGFTFDGVFGNEIFKGRRIRIVNSQSIVLLV